MKLIAPVALIAAAIVSIQLVGCRGTAPPVPTDNEGRPAETTAPARTDTTTTAATATIEPTLSVEPTLSPLDAFWQGVLAEARSVPLRPMVKPRTDLGTATSAVYEIAYSSLDGLRIHGFYARPRRTAGERSLPAVALLHGYGDHAYPEWATRFADRGFAAVSIDERGHGKSIYRTTGGGATKPYQPGFPGLMVDGIRSPRTYSMVGIVADSDRAIDFLVSRPEVDPNRIGVTGGSMGGAMSIILPALDKRVKASAAGVPYLCDIPDSIRLAKADPYLEVTRYLQKRPQDKKRVMNTLSHVDAYRFAPKVKVPVLVGVGMADYICPYQGILKTYKRLKGPREMLLRKDEGHVVLTGWREAVFEWMEKYL